MRCLTCALMYHALPFGHILIISVLKELGPYYTICVCRRLILEQQLASSQVPREEQINLIKDLERKETEYMRLKRHRICVDDFELLTIIGKGAYGQVCSSNFSNHFNDLFFCSIIFSPYYTSNICSIPK